MRKFSNQKTIELFGWALAIGFLLLDCVPVRAASFEAQDVIRLTNEARRAQNLPVVSENNLLNEAAKKKAADMIKQDYFAHTSPAGLSPWYWLQKVNYPYKYAGENLAINYTSAKEQQAAWMKSSSHRKNILNANFQEIGVAVVAGKIDGAEVLLTVQLFGAMMPATVVSAPQEKSVAPQAKGAEIENGAAEKPLEILPVSQPVAFELAQSGNKSALDYWQIAQLASWVIFGGAVMAGPLVFLTWRLMRIGLIREKQNLISAIQSSGMQQEPAILNKKLHNVIRRSYLNKVAGINSS